MAISINFTKTVDNAVDLSQKKTYINGAFTSASDIANFPTVGIATGSELVNVGGGNDTGKKYVFSGTAWNLAPSGGGGDNRFIVTLTPTAQDYSGTMDKTVAEIYDAYLADRKIVFRILTDAYGSYMEVDCTARWKNGQYAYPSFNGFIVASNSNMIIFAATGATDDGTAHDYGTTLYSLTPVS